MNADQIASSYRWLEYAAFGRELERARVDFLPHCEAARQVLILGEGDGRFLARLLQCNREASVVVIESSQRMIELARRRIPHRERSRVQFHQLHAGAHALPEAPYDLVITHFFLDLFSSAEAEAMIHKVNAALQPGAIWLLSEFQEPPGALRRQHARLWLAAMYGFFSLTTG